MSVDSDVQTEPREGERPVERTGIAYLIAARRSWHSMTIERNQGGETGMQQAAEAMAPLSMPGMICDSDDRLAPNKVGRSCCANYQG